MWNLKINGTNRPIKKKLANTKKKKKGCKGKGGAGRGNQVLGTNMYTLLHKE